MLSVRAYRSLSETEPGAPGRSRPAPGRSPCGTRLSPAGQQAHAVNKGDQKYWKASRSELKPYAILRKQ